jgi:hypothetical protein
MLIAPPFINILTPRETTPVIVHVGVVTVRLFLDMLDSVGLAAVMFYTNDRPAPPITLMSDPTNRVFVSDKELNEDAPDPKLTKAYPLPVHETVKVFVVTNPEPKFKVAFPEAP